MFRSSSLAPVRIPEGNCPSGLVPASGLMERRDLLRQQEHGSNRLGCRLIGLTIVSLWLSPFIHSLKLADSNSSRGHVIEDFGTSMVDEML